MAKTALITGVSGQDGAYLAKALLQRGYRVVGAYRRTSGIKVGRLEELGVAKDVELIDMELLEESNVRRALRLQKPDEIYNLAAQSFVGLSFEQPLYTADTDVLGVMRLLEAMREICPGARFYQASSSEMFGKAQQVPQNETTPFYPRSPYGVAKLFGPLERRQLSRGP
jgi:GDPmannose 4,6-dehydratase